MHNSQNAQIGPNLLHQTAEEEEEQRRNQQRLFKDSSNYKPRQTRRGKTLHLENAAPKENPEPKEKERFSERAKAGNKENTESYVKPNLIIQFQSDEDESAEQCPHAKQDKEEIPQPKDSSNNELKKLFTLHSQQALLLSLDSFGEEQQQQQKTQPVQNGQSSLKLRETNASENISMPKPEEKPQLLLNLSESEQQEEDSCESSEENQGQPNQNTVIALNTLVKENKGKYYLQPIPKGKVFECVIKRDKNENSIRYHVYDNITLRNFITIIKDQDGYLIVSKPDTVSSKQSDDNCNQRIIGRIVSNFFGTEFNCMVENQPYKSNKEYPSNPKRERVITIEYETNFFGMKGPRKMRAFMSTGPGFMGKGLNQVYQQERKVEKDKRKVLCFKNKPPIWRKQLGSYVLNFNGRATISSVKNFLMIGQNQNEQAVAKVLFGKFGKQLFNLDIRYPFNLLQGISLAISSFDRKLACQ